MLFSVYIFDVFLFFLFNLNYSSDLDNKTNNHPPPHNIILYLVLYYNSTIIQYNTYTVLYQARQAHTNKREILEIGHTFTL